MIDEMALNIMRLNPRLIILYRYFFLRATLFYIFTRNNIILYKRIYYYVLHRAIKLVYLVNNYNIIYYYTSVNTY